MAHTLILGSTEMGKGLLAKEIAQRHAEAGFTILALDPLLTPWPGSEFVTDDEEYFLAELEKWENCLLIVDEAGETVGRFGGAMRFVATKCRHLYHRSIFIVQKPGLIDPVVRHQCRYLALFSCSMYDAKNLGEDYPHADLKRAASLPQFEYLWASRVGPPGGLPLPARRLRVATPWLEEKENLTEDVTGGYDVMEPTEDE